ncbi:hypothetical protein H2248_003005 [Termitomyces sp. 'cryptogamus']|nr:hypothetical protein H2248_003005 [Termitomyces sp. 'cryptogamus']
MFYHKRCIYGTCRVSRPCDMGGNFRGKNRAIYDIPSPQQQDVNGHGTQCAAVAAGTKFGVAKKAHITAVQLTNSRGQMLVSGLFDGMAFIRQRYIHNGQRPSVVSMSFSHEGDDRIDEAVQSLIAEGMHVVAAAGNQGKDVATRSPARLSSVITVGASNLKYRATTRSNYGPRVDIFAPGYQIDTAKTGSTSGTSLAHGTSMATAHVAGVVVCIISQHGNLPPARMATKVKEWASDGVLIGLREDTANKLAFIRT